VQAMTGAVRTVRNLWLALAATGHKARAKPEVMRFNRAARQPHDLDDPFFDENVQIRIAETIAATGNKKTKNSY
jgi:hypothetical protein